MEGDTETTFLKLLYVQEYLFNYIWMKIYLVIKYTNKIVFLLTKSLNWVFYLGFKLVLCEIPHHWLPMPIHSIRSLLPTYLLPDLSCYSQPPFLSRLFEWELISKLVQWLDLQKKYLVTTHCTNLNSLVIYYIFLWIKLSEK